MEEEETDSDEELDEEEELKKKLKSVKVHDDQKKDQ